MPTYRFLEVKAQGSKNLPCPRCGKKVRRSTTRAQTISPFNLTADSARPATGAEIQAKVNAELRAWQAIHEKCGPCAELECGEGVKPWSLETAKHRCRLDAGHTTLHQDTRTGRSWASGSLHAPDHEVRCTEHPHCRRSDAGICPYCHPDSINQAR